jgi:molybdopterin-guanine dinucleotide biosynthesis protein A
LILSGGNSTRMGRDKAALPYRGRTEPDRLTALLPAFCRHVFRSVAAGSPSAPDSIPDRIAGIGPMGGILSALEHTPDAAWLVVACDMPFLHAETLRFLIAGRAPEKAATCLTRHGRLEPLCALYEPSITPRLRASVAQKEYGLRQVLAGLSIERIEVRDPDVLLNVNAPQEYEQARQRLEQE